MQDSLDNDLKEPLLSNFEIPLTPPGQRTIWFDGSTQPTRFTKNAVDNTKYTVLTFLPLVLFNQFKDFFNLFFLGVVFTQFVPQLQVGFLFSYLAPLIFVLSVTLIKEAYDDFQRRQRDTLINSQQYTRITSKGTSVVKSKDMAVGHILELHANERIPADLLILQTSEPEGTVYIRTDQMDGETDWKLRRAANLTQSCMSPSDFLALKANVVAEAPHRDIYSFAGSLYISSETQLFAEPLTLDNMLWANTTLAAGSAIAMVIYTGNDTKSRMNATAPRWKRGIADSELNYLAKLLFCLMAAGAVVLFILSGHTSNGIPRMFRYILLLSPMIPISLRVNLDLARIYYSWLISTDKNLPGIKARNSNLPEELGRVQVLLCDKTGTLTKNEMILRKLSLLSEIFSMTDQAEKDLLKSAYAATEGRGSKLSECVMALALCHNVTPIWTEDGKLDYLASSPDEIALVSFARSLGLELIERTSDLIILRTANRSIEIFKILVVFPFTSQRKRMGILLQKKSSGKIVFILKGAEEVMQHSLSNIDKQRILEECDGFAREGLRTLVVSQRELAEDEFNAWKKKYDAAGLELDDRDNKIQAEINKLEVNMVALGVTGVEDKLQDDVPNTIENMRNAGIKVWMLTGDKIETAECIASSTRLKSRDDSWHVIREMKDRNALAASLAELKNSKNKVPVVDGISLEVLLSDLRAEFVDVCNSCPSVVCCRVSPTQKAEVAKALKELTPMRVCSIGDGGNDVSMIQTAHIGIGIEGKEGKQAALASDFSVTEFKSLNMLLLWHGRLSYKRTAKLAQFIFHRGLILAVIQGYFISLFYFNALPLFTGFLLLGYSSYYTNLPVLSVILDSDSDLKTVLSFPLLYKALQKGRALSSSMFMWVLWKSLFQGSVIIVGILIFYNDSSFSDFAGLAFTTLILAEQLNVYSSIERFHWGMGVCQVLTLLIYLVSLFSYRSFFNLEYIFSAHYLIKLVTILGVCWLPLHFVNCSQHK
mmetsp:Transcript_12204/g.23149  ORF Transcript_12204/g.23149 Transcript_12204/m.23149 type:complete len:995 (+) Transcript_12204:1129-4113(+)